MRSIDAKVAGVPSLSQYAYLFHDFHNKNMRIGLKWRKRRYSSICAFSLVAITILILAFSIPAYSPHSFVSASSGATIVQSGSAGCTNSCSTSLSVTLSNPVSLGDVLVVVVTVPDPAVVDVTDTLSAGFVSAVADNGPVGSSDADIFYAQAWSGSSDTITATFNSNWSGEAIYVYDVSGVSVASPVTVTGSGASCSIGCTDSFSTSSNATYSSGSFVVAAIADNDGNGGTFTAGSPFSPLTSASEFGFSEYYVAGSSGSTNFPASLTGTYETGAGWAEAGLVLSPSVTLTATVTSTTTQTQASTVTQYSTVTAVSTVTSVSTTTASSTAPSTLTIQTRTDTGAAISVQVTVTGTNAPASITTNSAGNYLFTAGQLVTGDTYTVSTNINGAPLSASVVLSGNSVIVLEPTPASIGSIPDFPVLQLAFPLLFLAGVGVYLVVRRRVALQPDVRQ